MAERAQPRPLERVDRDVDLRPLAVPDLLAVGEHRRLVLLALADDDHAVHRHRVEDGVHAVDGGLVGGFPCRPRPTHRPAPMAAFSVTRTSSSARLRSGALGGTVISEACSATLLTGGIVSHSLRSLDPDQVEAACDDGLRRPAQAQTEGLRVALEHAVLG